MTIIEFIVGKLFFAICARVGQVVVKAVSLGKADLPTSESNSQSVVALLIGVVSVFCIAASIAWVIHK
jgi:hypothetical protein